jgi:hypothetical protein
MSEVAHESEQEFWSPPLPLVAEERVREALPVPAEVCPRCGTEFLLGSRFCHACGGRRPESLPHDAHHADAVALAKHWEQAVGRLRSTVSALTSEAQTRLRSTTFPSWLRYLHFHEIQRLVGLPTASLVAFIIGLACVAGALLVGLLTAKTYVDWQAIQFYRAEWLLAATAAFVAGILLKKPSRD